MAGERDGKSFYSKVGDSKTQIYWDYIDRCWFFYCEGSAPFLNVDNGESPPHDGWQKARGHDAPLPLPVLHLIKGEPEEAQYAGFDVCKICFSGVKEMRIGKSRNCPRVPDVSLIWSLLPRLWTHGLRELFEVLVFDRGCAKDLPLVPRPSAESDANKS